MRPVDADELRKHAFTVYQGNGVELEPIDVVPLAEIDNAQTVKFSLMPADESKEEAYLRGYKKGKVEGLLKARLQSEWIPVSERLPEEKLFNPTGSDFGFDFEEVLCTTIWGDVRAYKFGKPIGHDKPHFWLGGGIMDEYVIAWQYKPEPYKKGGDEE